jgi:hypothetical protein
VPACASQLLHRLCQICQEGRAIPYCTTHSEGLLSRYFHGPQKLDGLLVLEPERGRIRNISAYTPLYERFSDRANIFRVHCQPEHYAEARRCLTDVGTQQGVARR